MRRISVAWLLAVALIAVTGGAAFAADGGNYSAQSYAPSNQDHRVWLAGNRHGPRRTGHYRFQFVLPYAYQYGYRTYQRPYGSHRYYRRFGRRSYNVGRHYRPYPYYPYARGYGYYR